MPEHLLSTLILLDPLDDGSSSQGFSEVSRAASGAVHEAARVVLATSVQRLFQSAHGSTQLGGSASSQRPPVHARGQEDAAGASLQSGESKAVCREVKRMQDSGGLEKSQRGLESFDMTPARFAKLLCRLGGNLERMGEVS